MSHNAIKNHTTCSGYNASYNFFFVLWLSLSVVSFFNLLILFFFSFVQYFASATLTFLSGFFYARPKSASARAHIVRVPINDNLPKAACDYMPTLGNMTNFFRFQPINSDRKQENEIDSGKERDQIRVSNNRPNKLQNVDTLCIPYTLKISTKNISKIYQVLKLKKKHVSLQNFERAREKKT